MEAKFEFESRHSKISILLKGCSTLKRKDELFILKNTS
jgi:hypothetical protein